MNVKVIVHEAEEGGFWGEVPVLPGCASRGETMDDLIVNVREAIAGWLAADVPIPAEGERILDLALWSR
jgi:predicted RNase H-like HicB family nuclease